MKKILLPLLALALGGCAVATPHPTSMIFSPQGMEMLGPVRGASSSTRLLCVIPVSDGAASLDDAIQDALKPVNGDVIINPAVDDERGVGLLGLWCWQKIKVYGLAVRFKRPAMPQAQARPAAAPAGRAQESTGQPRGAAAGEQADRQPAAGLEEDIAELEKRVMGGGKTR
jgi:hypothetical protein